MSARHVVMAEVDHYEVCYTINPWMRPDEWGRGLNGPAAARRQWAELAEALAEAGLVVERVPAAPGLPDLVFTANSAVVLDRRALLARFRHPERRGEEAHFLRFFCDLQERGLIDDVGLLPPGMFQEGAGDCLWDAGRRLFWAGWGQRSSVEAPAFIAKFFRHEAVSLQLVTERFYHLDTCFLPLAGGEVAYYPPAFSPQARGRIAELVPADKRIEADDEAAAAFALNAVNLGRDLIMAPPPDRFRAQLEERGYRCLPVELSSFMLSGGAAFCMTLRLDHKGA